MSGFMKKMNEGNIELLDLLVTTNKFICRTKKQLILYLQLFTKYFIQNRYHSTIHKVTSTKETIILTRSKNDIVLKIEVAFGLIPKNIHIS